MHVICAGNNDNDGERFIAYSIRQGSATQLFPVLFTPVAATTEGETCTFVQMRASRSVLAMLVKAEHGVC